MSASQPPQGNQQAPAIFEEHTIRRAWHDEQWFYSVVDVVAVLLGSDHQDARKYWNKLAQRLRDEGADQTVTNCRQLKLPAADGKMRATDCADTQTMLRIIQSIPSPKAEPFKQWLAQVGTERLEELEDPEAAYIEELMALKDFPVTYQGKRIIRKGSLRDGMTAMELVVITFAEGVARAIHVQNDSRGLGEITRDVDMAADLARDNRLMIEELTGQSVVS